MIGYVTLGTNDMDRAAAFYDTLLAEVGARRLWAYDKGVSWGVSADKPSLAIMKPFDEKTATVGNGVMVAINVKSPQRVDELYRKAIELGGRDEGQPGPRGGGYYCAYFRDLDGNKLNIYCTGV